jgi:hypothetical protein
MCRCIANKNNMLPPHPDDLRLSEICILQGMLHSARHSARHQSGDVASIERYIERLASVSDRLFEAANDPDM